MRFQGLDLNLLVALDVLLKKQSVSAAAKKLCVSQSAMSHILARLRDYFGDELLVPVGRKLVMTERARILAGPVHEAVQHIDAVIAAKSHFDPEVSVRHFAILASDYSLFVGVAEALAAMKRQAPFLTFEVAYPSDVARRLQRGEADLVIVPQQYVLPEHPASLLFEDDYVVVVWSEGPLANKEIDIDGYFDSGHVAARFDATLQPEFAETLALNAPRQRRVQLAAPSFTIVPLMVVGTSLIATVPRRLAEMSAKTLPLTIKPLPFEAPQILEMVQWNVMAEHDPALSWIIEKLQNWSC